MWEALFLILAIAAVLVVLRLAKALRVPVERLLPTEPELKKRRCAS